MADLVGSESKYANTSGTASKTAAAKPMSTFGSSIVAPPISGPMQNLVPGSQEWVNARMASIIEQLKTQYGDAASRRGMLQSGAAEEELAKAIEDEQTKVALEAADYNANIANREDQQAHDRKMAKEAAKSQETAAMYSGLGSMAPYALFGKWGSDKGGESVFNADGTPKLTAAGTQERTQVVPAKTGIGKGWDALKSGVGTPASAPESKFGAPGDGSAWARLGMGALGTGVGTAFSTNKNKAPALLAGLGSTGLSAASGMSGGASAGLSGLAAGTLGSIKGNMLSSKNLWKTLLGGASMYASGGGFGKF